VYNSKEKQQCNPVTKLIMGKAGDPVGAGNYRAKFLRCEESEGNPAYPPAYRWSWEIVDGDHAGREISCLTSQKVNSMSNAGKVIAELNGSPIEMDDTVNLSDFDGVTYLCSVVEAGSGTKVDSVFRPR